MDNNIQNFEIFESGKILEQNDSKKGMLIINITCYFHNEANKKSESIPLTAVNQPM